MKVALHNQSKSIGDLCYVKFGDFFPICIFVSNQNPSCLVVNHQNPSRLMMLKILQLMLKNPDHCYNLCSSIWKIEEYGHTNIEFESGFSNSPDFCILFLLEKFMASLSACSRL